VPEKESPIGWIAPFLEPSLSEPYLRLPANLTSNDRVVILTPLRDASKQLKHFSDQLAKLTYPHHLVSVYFGEDGSSDDTFDIANQIANQLVRRHGFRDAKVFKLPINGNKSDRQTRHFPSKQIERRSHLAKARNLLTKLALKDEEWILWIDSDVGYFRDDVIQQFLFSDKDVMVASALVSKIDLGYFRTYGVFDRNTRRLKTASNGIKQYSTYVNDLKAEGREAKIDLVGACMLMIRADCLRKGLNFPEEPYMPDGIMVQFEGLESEGLGQLARDMGFEVYGLPFLEIYHLYDPDIKENWILNFLYFLYKLFL
jgi:glycosyltransferase involved in cell wall biosynthesis